MTRRPSPLLAALVVATAVSGALLWRYRAYPLMGWDVYPEILASRIESVHDLLSTFAEQTADGFYPFAFYRPVMNLSLALDYALWGIDPFGYRLSACLLVGVGALAMFGLCRRLLGPAARVGPWVGMAGFALLPVHGELVPLDSTRMDPLCGLFSMLALLAQFPLAHAHAPAPAPARPPAPWRLRLERLRLERFAALWTLLAVGSKEAGVLVVPVVFVLAFARASGPAPLARLRSAARISAPHLAATALVFVGRFSAIGALGGHPTTHTAGAVTRLHMALGLVTARISGLWTTDLGPVPLAALVLLSALVVLALLGLLLRAWRAPIPAGPTLAALGALAWLVCTGGIYGASGLLQSWHLLMPAIAACLAAAALAEFGHRERAGARRLLGHASLALALLWLGGQARHSPLVRPFGHWERGGAELRTYLTTLSRFIEQSPDGVVLQAPTPPRLRPADPNPLGSAHATLINYYSLAAWARLRHPDRQLVFRHAALGDDSDAPEPGALVVHLGRSAARRAP